MANKMAYWHYIFGVLTSLFVKIENFKLCCFFFLGFCAKLVWIDMKAFFLSFKG